MRAGIVVNVTRADRLRLEAIVADRSAPQKHVWRAKVILATADGCGTAEIMRRSGKSKPVVWTWQARFMAEGVEGLLRDKTRKPGKPPLPPNTVQRVVDLALGPPPGESTHWTGRELAKAAGVSLRSVQRILEAHQLAPHRIRTFKLWGTHGLHQGLGTQDGDHTLQIVGQNVEAHLCPDLFEGSGLEVGGAHPGLEGAERMFDGRAADAHALRRAVQPVLHGVESGNLNLEIWSSD